MNRLLRSWWTRSALLLLILALAGYWAGWRLLQSQWLAGQIRLRAIAEVERATGGRAELNGFTFDWRLWRATFDGFVLHGTEPAGAPPLVEVPRAAIDLKVLSFIQKKVNVAAIRLERPQVHLIRDAEGRWNFPEPAARLGSKSPVETVLDLAIGELVIQGAQIHYEDAVVPIDLRSHDFVAQLRFERSVRAYSGNFAMRRSTLAQPLAVPVQFDLQGPIRIDSAGLAMHGVDASVGKSALRGNVTLSNWRTPQLTLDGDGTVHVADLHKPLRLPIQPAGTLSVKGQLTAGSGDWHAAGDLAASGIAYAVRGIRINGVNATAAWAAAPGLVTLDRLRATALGGSFTGSARIANGSRFQVEGNAAGLELARLYALPPQTAQSGVPLVWSGAVSGPVKVEGVPNSFRASGSLLVTPPAAPAPGSQPVSGALTATYESAGNRLQIESGHMELPHTRLTVQGDLFQQLRFSLLTSDLDDLLPALRMATATPPSRLPVSLNQGQLLVEGAWNGSIEQGRVTGRLESGPATVKGHAFDRLETSFDAASTQFSLRDFRLHASGASLEGEGTIGLDAWRPVDSGRLSGVVRLKAPQLTPVLALAGYSSLPLSGAVNATLHLEGAYGSPAASGTVEVSNLTAWGEKIQSLKAEFHATPADFDIPVVTLAAGPGRATASASAQAPGGDWNSATIQFKSSGRGFTLEQWQYLQSIRKGFRGSLNTDASIVFRLVNGKPRISSIEGGIRVPDLLIDNRPLGEVTGRFATQNQTVTLRAEAIAGGARADGVTEWSLGSSGFGLGQFNFRNLTLATLQDLGVIDPSVTLPARGIFEGEIGFSGPILDPSSWSANLKLTRAELRPNLTNGQKVEAEANRFAIRNNGPLLAFVDKEGIRLTTAHMVGEGTDVQVSGTVGVRGRSPLNLNILGRMNLPALSILEPDLLATGQAQVDVQIRGGFQQPQILGTMGLQSASFYLQGIPNGLEKVNGTVRFDRNRATIEKFSALTGGGELTLRGFVGFSTSQLIYRLNAHASRVRIRYPEAVSTTFDGDLNLTGTSAQSLLSGTIVVDRLGLNPKTDLGSILADAARSAPADPIQNRALRGMQLDVKIETSPDAELQTSLTRDISPEADLRLRGTAARPTLLGRVSINEGEVQFFGNQYRITRGEVGFFNPTKIEPVLNLDLETRARGITVTINLSGPPNKLNISYRSDPPLQSNEIVALLTVGRAPSSTTTSNTPSNQGSSLMQSGGNSLLGAAISAPLSGPINNRLQRFFGVSRIKIDPELNTITNTPQARLTIEQQLSREITVTYITNLNRTQNQIVRLQWDFSRDFSVLAVRDENGIFGIDFQYRKRFK